MDESRENRDQPRPRSVQPGTASLKTEDAHKLYGYSARFLSAAEVLLGAREYKDSVVPAYLVCHSLELALKAYLSLDNVDIKKLKDDFGHDLEKLCEAAERLGLDIGSEERGDIRDANRIYRRKGLEYIVGLESLGVLVGATTRESSGKGERDRRDAFLTRIPHLTQLARRLLEELPALLEGRS